MNEDGRGGKRIKSQKWRCMIDQMMFLALFTPWTISSIIITRSSAYVFHEKAKKLEMEHMKFLKYKWGLAEQRRGGEG